MSLRISEIFGPTVQGEGALIGQPTVLVRSGGCDFRCSWCDSLHAVDSAFATIGQQWTRRPSGPRFSVCRAGGL
ncbi:7-carboxy-7-deazaguanine synthase [Ruegeria atlantica]|uniref:7-carboxy-7-deazaguanine synthase n=1 Tax=Ruegeria atlantica TaxID=81569 RepID=A0A0P1E1B7_9RHOB|nr:7-carboxy-7-deazaguanine synthase [Ruegeria atlantica]